jgi:Holliday junction resolvase RusA-like endonuclease
MDTFVETETKVETTVKTPVETETKVETPVKTIEAEPRVFEFDVNYPPTSLKRHRHSKHGTHTYDPSAKDKKEFLNKLVPILPKVPFDKPIRAELYFYETHPKSHYRTGKYADQLKPNCPTHNVVKKDIDNFVKFVFDTLNKHAYVDDSQIFELICGKYYSDREYSYICGKFTEHP